MSGSEQSQVTLKDFSGSRQTNRQRNKVSSGTKESTVSLWTARGRLTQTIRHGVTAAPDAVIDMARRKAAVPPEDFNRGAIQ